MKEDFDKRLSEHIKAVFDDAGNSDADAGWALLREKYPAAGNRTPFVWFWWLAATIIISGAGFGLWQIEKKTGKDKTIKTVAKAHNDSARQHVSPQRINNKVQSSGKSTTSPIVSNRQIIIKKPQSNPATTIASSLYNTGNSHLVQHLKTNWLSKKGQRKATVINKKNISAFDQISGSVAVGLSPVNSSVNQITSSTFSNNLLAGGINRVIIDYPELEFAKLPADQPKYKQSTAHPARKEHLKLLVPGVFISGFYNSDKGSDNEFNLAVGGSLDLNLSRHWSMSTGLGIARNTFNYIGYSTSNSYGSSSAIVVLLPSTDVLIAKITAIDIPLNVKYNFSSHNYISAGLSSFIYVHEYYDQIHNVASISTSSGSPQQHAITNKNFDGAGLFKTFNFSLAHGLPVGKKSLLIFEPFFKTAIGDIGSQNLKYNSVGLTLRLNFQSAAQ